MKITGLTQTKREAAIKRIIKMSEKVKRIGGNPQTLSQDKKNKMILSYTIAIKTPATQEESNTLKQDKLVENVVFRPLNDEKVIYIDYKSLCDQVKGLKKITDKDLYIIEQNEIRLNPKELKLVIEATQSNRIAIPDTTSPALILDENNKTIAAISTYCKAEELKK